MRALSLSAYLCTITTMAMWAGPHSSAVMVNPNIWTVDDHSTITAPLSAVASQTGTYSADVCVYCMKSIVRCMLIIHGSSQVSAGSVGPGNQIVPPHSPCRRNRVLRTVLESRRESAQTRCVSEVERHSCRQRESSNDRVRVRVHHAG